MNSHLSTAGHIILFAMLAGVAVPVLAKDHGEFSVAQISFFEKNIRPVLVEHCYKCHSEDSKVKGKLSLDSRGGMLRGGVSGPAIVPGNVKQSLLIAAVRYADADLSMPPKDAGGKLPASVIADLERWIEMGAPMPREETPSETHAYDPEKAKTWWSYQPITTQAVPSVKNKNWPLTGVDHFILAKLEEKTLQPVRSADKATLLRRVYIDLIGLPPSPSEQEKFAASNDPDLYRKVVDQLLAQPQFGERWGRHWMDVARYAETTGRDLNLTMPQAWRYRD